MKTVAIETVLKDLQARGEKIVKVASRAGVDGSMPAIAVVIGNGVDRDSIRAFGASRVGDVVEMSARDIPRTGDAIRVWLEPGSTDAERRAVSS